MIREAQGKDIPQITEMYYELLKVVYPKRELKPIENMYHHVVSWVLNEEFLIVTEEKNILTGFALVRETDTFGLTEPILDAELIYIKPDYRYSRHPYQLYNAVFDYAKYKGMAISALSFPEASNILEKRFGAEKSFEIYETPKEFVLNINNRNQQKD